MTDRFELLEQVGKGGMGTVWKARDGESGEIVALKLLHAHLADDEEHVQRLEREVEIAQRIDSPNVVKVLGYGLREGIPYMAMEFVEGKSLRQMLREKGPMQWDGPGQVRDIMRQAAMGLGAAHRAGVIHRDVKPSNILVASDGTVKLADFGISRAMDLTRMTQSAAMMGTPAYMAPDLDPGPLSDLYSLGVVAYEMLTGTPPFEGNTQQEVLMRHLREQPNLGRLPAVSRPVLARLLAKNPWERPVSAEALVALLEREAKDKSRPPTWLLIGVPASILLAAGAVVVGLVADGDDAQVVAAVETPTATQTATATATFIAEVAPSQSPTLAPTSIQTPTISPTTLPSPTSTNPSLFETLSPRPSSTPTPTPTSSPTPTATPTLSDPIPPPVSESPRNLRTSFSADRGGYAVLSWDPVPGAIAYEVTRQSSGGVLGTTPGATLTVRATTVTVENNSIGFTSWRVRGIGQFGEYGPYSDWKNYYYYPATPTPSSSP